MTQALPTDPHSPRPASFLAMRRITGEMQMVVGSMFLEIRLCDLGPRPHPDPS
jgi:hypothetical protein